MGWIQAHFYRTVPLIHCHEVVYKDGPQANQAHTFIATPYSKCRPLGSKGRNSTCACPESAPKNTKIGQDLSHGASLFYSNQSVCMSTLFGVSRRNGNGAGGDFDPPGFFTLEIAALLKSALKDNLA